MNANEYTSLINNVVFNGNENNIKINSNCSNISQIKNGFNNNIFLNEKVLRNNQNSLILIILIFQLILMVKME